MSFKLIKENNKVSEFQNSPYIKLSSKDMLSMCGFKTGDRLSICYEENKITISKYQEIK